MYSISLSDTLRIKCTRKVAFWRLLSKHLPNLQWAINEFQSEIEVQLTNKETICKLFHFTFS